MSEDPGRQKDAVETEREMREHERQARERDEDERGEDMGTPDSDAMPAPPGNVQRGTPGS